jgi:hypothetical protein
MFNLQTPATENYSATFPGEETLLDWTDVSPVDLHDVRVLQRSTQTLTLIQRVELWDLVLSEPDLPTRVAVLHPHEIAAEILSL